MAGFIICWTTAASMRHLQIPANGAVLFAALCGVHGVLMIPIAVMVRGLRSWPVLIASPIGAILATLSREALAGLFGVDWLAHAIALPAAATHAAQWSAYIGQRGVAVLVLMLNLLFSANRTWQFEKLSLDRPMRLLLARGICVWAIMSATGALLASRTPEVRFPFRVMLVQPHVEATVLDFNDRATALDVLTRSGLSTCADVDLVVWPESSIDARGMVEDVLLPPKVIQNIRRESRPAYLTGVVRTRPVDHTVYGIPTVRLAQMNSAALISSDGAVQYHDKQKLLPLIEYVPAWMKPAGISDWLRCGSLEPGLSNVPLRLRTHDDRPVVVAVAICYEKYFASLPQFQRDYDAIIHLTENSWCRGNPLIPQIELWTCQFRAIETRTWQVLVSSWQDSGVIDPRGGVRQSVGSRAGWLVYPTPS